MVAYRGGPLSVKPAASETKNTPALSYKLFTNDVGLRVSNSFGFMLGGKYELTPKAAIFAGVEHTDQTIPSSSNNWSAQITSYYNMPIAGLVTAKAFASAWGDAPIGVLWAGADYRFTDNFSLSVGYYNVNNEANSHNDQYTNQQFAIMPDYKFNERFDVYAGLMIAHYTGAYLTQFSPITLATSNVLYGIGLRAKISKGILYLSPKEFQRRGFTFRAAEQHPEGWQITIGEIPPIRRRNAVTHRQPQVRLVKDFAKQVWLAQLSG
jgi:predicted porin